MCRLWTAVRICRIILAVLLALIVGLAVAAFADAFPSVPRLFAWLFWTALVTAAAVWQSTPAEIKRLKAILETLEAEEERRRN